MTDELLLLLEELAGGCAVIAEVVERVLVAMMVVAVGLEGLWERVVFVVVVVVVVVVVALVVVIVVEQTGAAETRTLAPQQLRLVS
jgi:cytochrome c oxidase subunit IV